MCRIRQKRSEPICPVEPIIQQRGKGGASGVVKTDSLESKTLCMPRVFSAFATITPSLNVLTKTAMSPGNDRPVFEFQTTLGSFVERVGDFVGTIFGGTAAQDVFVEYFVVFAVEPAYLYGSLGRRRRLSGTCGADFGIVYAVQDEKGGFAAEQCAYAVNQLGVASVVVASV